MNMPGRRRIPLTLLLIALIAPPALGQAVPAEAPPDASKPPAAEVTAETIQAQIGRIKAATDLDDAAKSKLLDTCQQALAELDRANTLVTKAGEFVAAAKQAPEKLEQLREKLDAPPAAPPAEVGRRMTLAQLETAQAQAQAALTAAQDDLTKFEAEPRRRADRQLEIPKKIDEANKKLEDIDKQLAAAPSADETKEQAAARRALLLARQMALRQEIGAMTSERESYNAEDALLPKQRDFAERQVTLEKQLVEALQQAIHNRRQQEAEAKLREAKQEKRQAWPELRGLAAENEELAARASKISDQIAGASKQTVDFGNAQAELEREFHDLADKLNTPGLSLQLGPYLLQFRVDLERRRRQLESVRLARSAIDSARMELMALTDQRKKLGDVDTRTDAMMRELSRHKSPRGELEKKVRDLLQTRRDLLDTLTAAYEHYIRQLASLLAADKKLFDEIDREGGYIDERILWVRSTSRLGRSDLAAAREALAWFAVPERWGAVGHQLLAGLMVWPAWTLFAFVVFIGLLAGQRRMRARLKQLGDQAARGTADDMSVTLRALLFSLLMAAPWPAGLAFIAGALAAAPQKAELTKALAHGLYLTAGFLAALELLRQVCRSRGLGSAHFGWPEPSLRLMRRHLRWFMPVGLPLGLVAATTHALDNDRFHALGRLLFMAAMVLLSLFVQRVFRPVGGVLNEFLAYRRGGWLDRLNYVAFPLLVGSPLALAVLAALGYHYTAQQLAARLQGTAWLLVAFMIAGALTLRWLLIMRRRLAIRQARQRRAAALVEARGPDGAELPAVAISEAQPDLTTLNQQTRRFVQTALVAGFLLCLSLVWSEVLPALSFLDQPLWHTTIDVVELQQQPDDTMLPIIIPRNTAINVSHLMLACLIVALTMVAARNLPGLLEIVLLQRLPLEPATRYAVTTLSRYVIAVTGMVLVCFMLGITWDKVHWLIAAVSVGLGFGLQEIFANFVSGLIILFERPVRVGDIVTVDDVSGVVSRIRIRATVITDFDRKELIVPNREFITGRVLNWTLSDQMNRVVINVGVAYGSDIDRVRDLLVKTARDNAFVLADPAPMATFEGFGDSSLSFVLRCYLPNLENRMSVVHDLHAKIHDRCRDEGIDIAFPQLDLHIRTSPVALYQRQAG